MAHGEDLISLFFQKLFFEVTQSYVCKDGNYLQVTLRRYDGAIYQLAAGMRTSPWRMSVNLRCQQSHPHLARNPVTIHPQTNRGSVSPNYPKPGKIVANSAQIHKRQNYIVLQRSTRTWRFQMVTDRHSTTSCVRVCTNSIIPLRSPSPSPPNHS